MIIRRRVTKGFTNIPRDVTNDSRHNPETLGVHVYLLSRPDRWKVHGRQLCARFKCGRDRMYGILKKIENMGYINRHVLREAGRFNSIEYVITDEPHTEKPDAAMPGTEIPPVQIELKGSQYLKETKALS